MTEHNIYSIFKTIFPDFKVHSYGYYSPNAIKIKLVDKRVLIFKLYNKNDGWELKCDTKIH